MTIKWRDEYSVCNEKIDNQHKQILGIVDDFLHKKENEITKESLVELLDKLQEFGKVHFKSEEEIFMKIEDYEDKYYHQKIHQEHLEAVEELRKKIEEESIESVKQDVRELLLEWWTKHVLDVDRFYGEYCCREKARQEK